MTIEEFIEARLSEREGAASKAIEHEHNSDSFFDVQYNWACFLKSKTSGRSNSVSHMSGAPAPDEVLRQCAALRSVVERARFVADHGPAVDHVRALDMTTGAAAALRDVLRMIATTWPEHPDYRPEWAVDGEGTNP